MATIIKIVLGLAVLTMAAQAGMAAFTNYQLEDEVHEALLFAPNSSEIEIYQMVREIAEKHGIAINADDVTVKELGPELTVSLSYETEVNLLPGIYSRQWTFSPETSIRIMPKGPRRR